jgi:hypothetical protein
VGAGVLGVVVDGPGEAPVVDAGVAGADGEAPWADGSLADAGGAGAAALKLGGVALDAIEHGQPGPGEGDVDLIHRGIGAAVCVCRNWGAGFGPEMARKPSSYTAKKSH